MLTSKFVRKDRARSLLGLFCLFSPCACSSRDISFDVARVLSRSDIHLGQANVRADQAMPLGNGRLGVAVWSGNGFTAQLNRADTMPYRYSPGQVVIPGLAALTSAKDYSGRLDLYDGTFEEHGGGMTVTVFVQRDTDTLIVEITGANPAQPQTAQLKLWAPRTPQASAAGTFGTLSQTWTDNHDPGASGRTFGSLAAITAIGRNVSVAVTDPLTITVTVTPNPDGRFEILAAAPHYDGKGDVRSLAGKMLKDTSPLSHKLWWNAFWSRAGLIQIGSLDGSGEYMENLRNIYLFAAAASSGGEYPGSHAGLADLFSSVGDLHRWDPAAFWHWNLRMQVAANLGAGVPELNLPYLRLYRENLKNMEDWAFKHMEARPGVCVPETMRFNGQGIEYEKWSASDPPTTALDCDAGWQPYYNARTISTGAEVSLWIWQQYLLTNDLKFLRVYYPLMAASARFLLAYTKPGRDGLEHTNPSNAHETQWDVMDPTTDIAARMSLYPVTIRAAQLLGRDAELIGKLQSALTKIPPFPRTQHSGPLSLLPPSDRGGEDVIADSYLPGAKTHNYENIGLEPIWPYNLIGDTSPLFALAKRTYQYRRYPINQDWSFDPIQAARLGLGSEVGATLIKLTTKYQTFVNGFANWGGSLGEFYIEQSAVVAAALQEALVQDYDGVIRIAPATPPGWNFDGAVAVRGNGKVYVQVRNGVPTGVAIAARSNTQFKLHHPWPGQPVDVVDGVSGFKTVKSSVDPIITVIATAGATYFVERSKEPARPQFFAASHPSVNSVKKLGPVQIGLPPQ
ncbi:MAG: glycoside hydrolase [Acidobacteriaceae bacterium]|nr:glycoside hydrolase [Acidobacteriaceae bacterium]